MADKNRENKTAVTRKSWSAKLRAVRHNANLLRIRMLCTVLATFLHVKLIENFKKC